MKKLIIAALLFAMPLCASAKQVDIFRGSNGSRILFDTDSFAVTEGGFYFARIFVYNKGERTISYTSVQPDECREGAGTLLWSGEGRNAPVYKYAFSLDSINDKEWASSDAAAFALCVMGGAVDETGKPKPVSNSKPKVRM